MTIYIDDDWNACAPVRKMWRESTSCRDTKRGSEPRRGWQPVVCVLRQIERTQRVLYTLTLTFDMNVPPARQQLSKRKRLLSRMLWLGRVALHRALQMLLQADSNYAYRS